MAQPFPINTYAKVTFTEATADGTAKSYPTNITTVSGGSVARYEGQFPDGNLWLHFRGVGNDTLTVTVKNPDGTTATGTADVSVFDPNAPVTTVTVTLTPGMPGA